MSIVIFQSCVSGEFGGYREALEKDFTRHNVHVKVQEKFQDLGGYTLDKLDVYVRDCDAVVHLVGELCGSEPGEEQREAVAAFLAALEEFTPEGASYDHEDTTRNLDRALALIAEREARS